MTPRRKACAWALGAALAYFLVCSLLFLGRFGLHNDEGIRGVHALENLFWLRDCGRGIWHVMESSYVGSFTSYMPVPFIALLGPVGEALRLPYIPLVFAALLLIWATLRRIFGTPTATLTVCLLAVNSTFIQCTRVGCYREEVIQIFLFWSMLGLLVLPRRPALVAAAFVAGAALWVKIMFAGYLAGFAVALALFRPPWKCADAPPGPARLAAMGAAFLAGMSPLICWNAVNGWRTPVEFLKALHRSSSLAVLCNNTNFATSLHERLVHLLALLTSSIPGWLMDGCDAPVPNGVYLFLFAAALSGILVFCLRPWGAASRRKIGFFIAVYAVLFLCTCFSPSARDNGHIAILLPLPELLIAFFLFHVMGRLRLLRTAFAVLLGLHVLAETALMGRALDRIRRGDIDTVDLVPAQTDIVAALQAQHAESLVSFCGGMMNNILYLCGNELHVFGPRNLIAWKMLSLGVAGASDLGDVLPDPGHIPEPAFLLRGVSERSEFETRGWLAFLRSLGWRAELFKTFGPPDKALELYRLVRCLGPESAADSADGRIPPPPARPGAGASGKTISQASR